MKQNILILSICISLLLISTTLAFWTEKFTVNGQMKTDVETVVTLPSPTPYSDANLQRFLAETEKRKKEMEAEAAIIMSPTPEALEDEAMPTPTPEASPTTEISEQQIPEKQPETTTAPVEEPAVTPAVTPAAIQTTPEATQTAIPKVPDAGEPAISNTETETTTQEQGK